MTVEVDFEQVEDYLTFLVDMCKYLDEYSQALYKQRDKIMEVGEGELFTIFSNNVDRKVEKNYQIIDYIEGLVDSVNKDLAEVQGIDRDTGKGVYKINEE